MLAHLAIARRVPSRGPRTAPRGPQRAHRAPGTTAPPHTRLPAHTWHRVQSGRPARPPRNPGSGPPRARAAPGPGASFASSLPSLCERFPRLRPARPYPRRRSRPPANTAAARV